MSEPQVTYQRYANRVFSGILPPYWDKLSISYPTDTTEVYIYSARDVEAGTDVIQASILVTYTDNTKCNISSIDKTFQIGSDC